MDILIASAVISTALVAGIFYAFSTFVMRALARVKPSEGMAAMQAINVTVLNPWFFGAFFGAGIVSIACVVAAFVGEREESPMLVMVGAAVYLIGCIGVTIAGNVPLNDRLAATSVDAENATQVWADYLKRWNFWNHVRTVASLAAAIVFGIAL